MASQKKLTDLYQSKSIELSKHIEELEGLMRELKTSPFKIVLDEHQGNAAAASAILKGKIESRAFKLKKLHTPFKTVNDAFISRSQSASVLFELTLDQV